MFNYVRFVKGLKSKYDTLQMKDKNTLYFVYENEDSTIGQLFLGTKLISANALDLKDLADLSINNLVEGNVLTYDPEEEKWVNKPVKELIPVFQAAIDAESEEGTPGFVPAPPANDNLYLRSDATWADPLENIETIIDDEIHEQIQIPHNVGAFENDVGYLTQHQDISGKQNVIPDLDQIRSNAQIGAAAYHKPPTGIPENDLATSVRNSLSLANSALQSHQDISSKEDKNNKTDTINAQSTNTQYPSAQAVYNALNNKLNKPSNENSSIAGMILKKTNNGSQWVNDTSASSSRVDELANKITANENNITTINENISTIEDNITTINDNIENIEGDITDINTALTNKQDIINDLNDIRTKANNAVQPPTNSAANGNYIIVKDSNGTSWQPLPSTPDELPSTTGHNGDILSIDNNGNIEWIDPPTIPTTLVELAEDNDHKLVTNSEKTTWNNKYSKPNSGIPASDLTESIQTSIGKADTALQTHQDISGKEDKSNKTDTINAQSTSAQYPNAQAVYNALNGKQDTISNLSTIIDNANRAVQPPDNNGRYIWVKNDNSSDWADVPTELPTGGSDGQYLKKTSNGVTWDTPSGSGGGSDAVLVRVTTDKAISETEYSDFDDWTLNGASVTEHDACTALYNAFNTGAPCSLIIHSTYDTLIDQVFIPQSPIMDLSGSTSILFIAFDGSSLLPMSTQAIHIYRIPIIYDSSTSQANIGNISYFSSQLVSQNEKNTWNSKLTPPNGGNTGQVLTKTASGYAWDSNGTEFRINATENANETVVNKTLAEINTAFNNNKMPICIWNKNNGFEILRLTYLDNTKAVFSGTGSGDAPGKWTRLTVTQAPVGALTRQEVIDNLNNNIFTTALNTALSNSFLGVTDDHTETISLSSVPYGDVTGIKLTLSVNLADATTAAQLLGTYECTYSGNNTMATFENGLIAFDIQFDQVWLGITASQIFDEIGTSNISITAGLASGADGNEAVATGKYVDVVITEEGQNSTN